MTQPNFLDAPEASQTDTSFGDILNEFEQSHQTSGETQLEGTVLSVSPDGVFVDIGRKNEGILPFAENLVPGQKVQVNVRGRDEQGNYQLSTIKVEVPKDWSGLEAMFAEKRIIGGTVVEAVKGGLRVDIGVRAFMPASRSGVREVADLPNLIGQQIECRITKLDTAAEDVVVDRRSVLEEREKAAKQEAFEKLQEGAVVTGKVRSVMDFGAFLDLGGVDGLLHVADMTWSRGVKPSDVVKVGDSLEVKILKVNRDTRKIGLGLKQLSPDPWSLVAQKYTQGSRVTGTVARVTDFGAFVQLEQGIEGLIHVSEMSWTKRNVRAADVVKPGEQVEVVVLEVKPADKRIGLGLKQALGDPWEEVLKKHPVGSVVEAPVTSLAKFGAFVDLGNGIEGMVHIGDISREKRLDHPNEMLKVGQVVKAKVTEADRERRRLRLSIKELEPTSADNFIAEHKVGDVITGRIVDVSPNRLKVELGEGVSGIAKLAEKKQEASSGGSAKADVSALSAMLTQRWKTGGGVAEKESNAPRVGQVREVRITAMNPENRRVDVELV